ncbi:MAG: hypothetical protein WAU58_15010 [Terriglobales bacterium]
MQRQRCSKLAGRALAANRLVLVFFVLGAALPSLATTWTVTDTSDSASDTGSLRYALGQAQNGDTIVFSLPNPSTITLTNGALTIKSSVTISGPGPSAVAINGNAKPRWQRRCLFR